MQQPLDPAIAALMGRIDPSEESLLATCNLYIEGAMTRVMSVEQNSLILNNMLRAIRTRNKNKGPDANIHALVVEMVDNRLYHNTGTTTSQQLLSFCIGLRDVIRQKCSKRLPHE